MKAVVNRLLRWPDTKPGKWSLGLIVAMFLLFFAGTSLTTSMYASVPAGGSITQDIAARPALALAMLAGMTAGVLSFVIGLVAIVKQKERSLFVYLSTVIGMLLSIFLVLEFIFPH